MTRGRKSGTSLTVVPVIPGSGRPPPPRGLDREERRLWTGIVDSLPSHWLDQAGQLILRRVVSLSASLERWEVQLRELRAGDAAGSDEAIKLAVQHGNTAKVVTYLLGQLRATPRSRDRARAAGSKVAETPRVRPWEIRSHGPDSA
jgi:hypothetical protein